MNSFTQHYLWYAHIFLWVSRFFPRDCLISLDEYATILLSVPLLIDFLMVLTPIDNFARIVDFLEDRRTDQTLNQLSLPEKSGIGEI